MKILEPKVFSILEDLDVQSGSVKRGPWELYSNVN